MQIFLNQTLKEIPAHTSLQKVLDQELPNQQKGIAVAVNQTIIPKKDWQHHLLSPNDEILIIKATQGG